MKTARKKRLNIGNTDRYFNIQLVKREDIGKKIKVTRLNEEEIEKNMDLLAARSHRMKVKDNNEYLIYQETYTNDKLIQKIINHGGRVSYYTDSIVPYYVLEQLSRNLKSEVIYSLRPSFTSREIENIELSAMATPVTLDIPIVLPDMSPYDLLFILHPLKTNVDSAQISFPPLQKSEMKKRHYKYYHRVNDHYEMKPKYKYAFFKYVQTSLSIWKMNIFLVCDSDEDYDAVNAFVQEEITKRTSNRNTGTSIKGGD